MTMVIDEDYILKIKVLYGKILWGRKGDIL